MVLFLVVRTGSKAKDNELTFTTFLNEAQEGKIDKVTISGDEVHGTYKQNPNGPGLHTFIPVNYPDVYTLLREKDVNVEMKPANSGSWVSILVQASPFI